MAGSYAEYMNKPELNVQGKHSSLFIRGLRTLYYTSLFILSIEVLN